MFKEHSKKALATDGEFKQIVPKIVDQATTQSGGNTRNGDFTIMLDSSTSLFDSEGHLKKEKDLAQKYSHMSSKNNLQSLVEESNIFDHKRLSQSKPSLDKRNLLQRSQQGISSINGPSLAMIASGGAPLRTSFQDLPRREATKLSA